jgi:hypothetical protein
VKIYHTIVVPFHLATCSTGIPSVFVNVAPQHPTTKDGHNNTISALLFAVYFELLLDLVQKGYNTNVFVSCTCAQSTVVYLHVLQQSGMHHASIDHSAQTTAPHLNLSVWGLVFRTLFVVDGTRKNFVKSRSRFRLAMADLQIGLRVMHKSGQPLLARALNSTTCFLSSLFPSFPETAVHVSER